MTYDQAVKIFHAIHQAEIAGDALINACAGTGYERLAHRIVNRRHLYDMRLDCKEVFEAHSKAESEL